MAVIDQVKRFFEIDEWEYAETEEGLRIKFGGRNGVWDCLSIVREQEGQFLFLSSAPVTISPEQYSPVAEYLMRANFGLFIGNFELDFEAGTVQFRTSIDVEGDEAVLSPLIIKHLVYQNVITMDKYLPGLSRVLDASASPAAAVYLIESSTDPD